MKKVFKFLKFWCWQWHRIPQGPYCYFSRRSRPCSYWDIKKDWPNQANGYCKLLKRGDMDKNNDSTCILVEVKRGVKVAAPDMPFGIGLLWDQCKECGYKEDSLFEKIYWRFK